MRILIVLFLLILTFGKASFAQNNSFGERFEKVDRQVSDVSKQFIYHPQLLVEKLTENLNNDYDKVRAIYVWIALNTKYDMFAYYHHRNDGQGVYDVLGSGKALCSGFSMLFQYLCAKADIQTEIIDGYAKGFDYKKGQKFKNGNHAWNAVFIHGAWYLLDVTWAAENPIFMSGNPRKIDLDTYFLVPPEKMIKTHLPEDPTWQLLKNKISLAEFEKNNGEPFKTVPKYFNAFVAQDYLYLDEYDKDIKRYKRAVDFNALNNELKMQLGFAYLYKGISMTDYIREMDYADLSDTLKMFCEDFNSYLDSAWITIADLKSWKLVRAKRIIKEEQIYQKGVFNYEIGKELYLKGQQAHGIPDQLEDKVEFYFKEAEEYFKNVPPTSIYLNDAYEYLKFISDFRMQNQTTTQFPVN
jgi:hypothetical protein